MSKEAVVEELFTCIFDFHNPARHIFACFCLFQNYSILTKNSNNIYMGGCGIVDIVCDCYTSGRSSIPTHRDSLGK